MSRVTEYLRERDVAFEVIPHSRAFTSVTEAIALGLPAREVVKTLMVDTATGRAIVVIPGSRRLDMHLVRKAVQDHDARLTSEEDLREDYPDLELGCLPPLGSFLRVPMYVDPEVLALHEFMFAGCQTESVKVRTEDLFGREQLIAHPLHEVRDRDEEKGADRVAVPARKGACRVRIRSRRCRGSVVLI